MEVARRGGREVVNRCGGKRCMIIRVMSARWWTLVVWALAAASAVYWSFKLFVTPLGAPAHTQTATSAAFVRGDLARILGADAPPPPEPVVAEAAPDARFQLVGVVSPRSPFASREGLALIAVDGKPAKAYRVGAVVDGQTVLQAVAPRGATLGPRGGAALVALNIAPPAAAATGSLPSIDAGGLPQPTVSAPTPPPFVLPRVTVPGQGLPPVQMPPPQAQQPQPQMRQLTQTQPPLQRRPIQPAQDTDDGSAQGTDAAPTR